MNLKYEQLVSKFFDKCDRFFEVNNVEEKDGVSVASIHLEGKALEWFQGYEIGAKEITWETFAIDLTARFGRGRFDNPVGQLPKLRQLTSVKYSQEQFETLMARTRGLTEEFLVECFISGLKDAICPQVVMFQPTTLSQAIGLALL